MSYVVQQQVNIIYAITTIQKPSPPMPFIEERNYTGLGLGYDKGVISSYFLRSNDSEYHCFHVGHPLHWPEVRSHELNQRIFLTQWRHQLFNYGWQCEFCPLSLWGHNIANNRILGLFIWYGTLAWRIKEAHYSTQLWAKRISGLIGTDIGGYYA